jgi:hypothetical protein
MTKQLRGMRLWKDATGKVVATVIYTPNAAWLVWQHRLDGGSFIIAEFVTHDSRLRFWSLNHVSGSAINPQWPMALPRML